MNERSQNGKGGWMQPGREDMKRLLKALHWILSICGYSRKINIRDHCWIISLTYQNRSATIDDRTESAC